MQSRTTSREQQKTEAELLDEVRARSCELAELFKEIELRIDAQHQHAKATADVDEMQRLQLADPYRWLADAKHSLQAGVMFAKRSVEQPTTF